MVLERIMLSEKASRYQKFIYYMILFIKHSGNENIIRVENILWFPRFGERARRQLAGYVTGGMLVLMGLLQILTIDGFQDTLPRNTAHWHIEYCILAKGVWENGKTRKVTLTFSLSFLPKNRKQISCEWYPSVQVVKKIFLSPETGNLGLINLCKET